ncbi:hypothetical protein V6Z11_A07G068100 [Gossypium hirsutum]
MTHFPTTKIESWEVFVFKRPYYSPKSGSNSMNQILLIAFRRARTSFYLVR